MATLATLRTRIERAIGLYGATPSASLQGMALDSINNALIGLARGRKWYWWLEKDETTLALLAAGTESTDLPADCGHIECIVNSDGEILEPKTPTRQLHYPEYIGAGDKQTYAIGGYNSSTRRKTILWNPAVITGGDYTLWYYRIPALLSADSDQPDMPDEFHDYLFWRALQIMLIGDEERASVIAQAENQAQIIYKDMTLDHANGIETLTSRIYATP